MTSFEEKAQEYSQYVVDVGIDYHIPLKKWGWNIRWVVGEEEYGGFYDSKELAEEALFRSIDVALED